MHFGVVPVPNLCVELRGYDATATEETSASASTSGPAHSGNGDDGVATASVTAGHNWHGWGEAKPRFLQLQRTGESDGSFAFVTPSSGMLLVVAAYPHGGENPIVRVFPDETSAGQGASGVGGGASAFGADSGRVQMHIDLSEGTHASEVLWSAAAREKDQSPCARHEATAAMASGSLGAAMGGDKGAAAAAARENTPPAEQRRSWSLGEELSQIYHGGGGGGGTVGDQAKMALTALLHSSRRYVGELGAGLWEAKAAVCTLLRSGLQAAGRHAHQSALAVSTAAEKWFRTMDLSSRLAQLSPTMTTAATGLSSWFWQRSTSAMQQVSAWFGEAPCTGFVSWLEQRSPVDLRAWWAVWWARVGVIALFLCTLQEVFVFVHRYFEAAAVVADSADRRCPGSPRQDQDQEPAAGTSGTLVGTFHSSNGRVSQIDLGKFGRPEEPATTGRKERGRGILSAFRGSSGRGGDGGGGSRSTSKRADEMKGGNQEEADAFSSMFRALSQPSCGVTGTGSMGEQKVGGGATSNVVVVTQQSWQ